MVKRKKVTRHRKGERIPQRTYGKKILTMKTELAVHFSTLAFWTALVLMVIGTILVSIALIPFLIVLTPELLYTIVIIFAGVLGFLYAHIIMDISHIGRKHHLAAAIILPVIGFVNAIIMVIVSNRIIADLPFVKNPGHNPGIIGGLFAVAFILPYIYKRFARKR
jgi:uncharacterized membrane protein